MKETVYNILLSVKYHIKLLHLNLFLVPLSEIAETEQILRWL